MLRPAGDRHGRRTASGFHALDFAVKNDAASRLLGLAATRPCATPGWTDHHAKRGLLGHRRTGRPVPAAQLPPAPACSPGARRGRSPRRAGLARRGRSRLHPDDEDDPARPGPSIGALWPRKAVARTSVIALA